MNVLEFNFVGVVVGVEYFVTASADLLHIHCMHVLRSTTHYNFEYAIENITLTAIDSKTYNCFSYNPKDLENPA